MKNVVHESREFLADERPRHDLLLPAGSALIEGSDLRIVLDRPHGHVRKGELEVAIAILAPLVPRLSP